MDNIPKRNLIDRSINQHGHDFIEFLNEAKLCALNGRFPDGDNFTSISNKGKAVVDFMCVPQELFWSIKSFQVHPLQTIVDSNELQYRISTKCKLPDHSFLLCEFNTGHCLNFNHLTNDQTDQRPRFKFDKIPPSFMDSDMSRAALLNIMDEIEHSMETQNNIDDIYNNLCSVILSEMNEKIPKTGNVKTSKRMKIKRPYWNDTLTDLWKIMCEKEKTFLQCDGSRNRKAALRREYGDARDKFDKTLRRSEKEYRRSVSIEIENISTTNSNEFLDKIRKLGPRTNKTIPMEIVTEDGEFSTNEQTVLDRWRRDFECLYNGSNSDEFEVEHYNRSLVHKQLLEQNMLDPLFEHNEDLNSNIEFEEISRIVMNAKSKSACGHDEIPYCVLKYPPVIRTIHELFQLVFDTSIIPSVWRKAIICPILKDASADKRMPMNYRGVSLLSCISKLYSAFINHRLVTYLENNDTLTNIMGSEETDHAKITSLRLTV